MVHLAFVAVALATTAFAAPSPAVLQSASSSSATSAQSATSSSAKVCDDASKICYTEYIAPNNVAYRIAIPDTASASAPFDIALSMIAPKAVGWAAIAWGGAMANNPLTVGWANGASAVVSSRRAAGHTLPTAYAGASYKVLPSTKTNATHWQLDVVCSGCSAWTGAGTTKASLDPASSSVAFAYASSGSAPADPTSNTTRFGIHNAKGRWTHDLSSAKAANFESSV